MSDEQDTAGHRYAGPRFAMAPEWLIAAGLTGAEWQVYLAHRLFANAQTAETYAHRDTVREVAGVSLATYKRAMTRLVEVGAVERVKPPTNGRGFRGFIYHLPMDRPAKPQVTTGGSPGEPPGGSFLTGGSPGEPGGGSPGEPGGGSSGEPPREQTIEQTNQQISPRGRAAARRIGQAELGLDVEPTKPASTRGKAGGDPAVAAYIEAYETAHGKRPLGRDIGKVGSASKRLRERDALDESEVVEAARAMGVDGRWSDLEREINLRRTGGNPGRARTSTGRGPSQARCRPEAVRTDFSPEAMAWHNFPDLVLEHERSAERPQTPPRELSDHRRSAEEHGVPFDEYVTRYNLQQAEHRAGNEYAFREFGAYLDRMKAAKEQSA